MSLSTSSPQTTLIERVLPSASTFLPLVIIYPSLLLVFLPIAPLAGHIIGALLTIGAASLMFANSPVIRLSAKELYVGRGTLQIEEIASVETIDKASAFKARTSELDSRAWLSLQPGVQTYLKIYLKPNSFDKTPYWLISTRRGSEIAQLIQTAKK